MNKNSRNAEKDLLRPLQGPSDAPRTSTLACLLALARLTSLVSIPKSTYLGKHCPPKSSPSFSAVQSDPFRPILPIHLVVPLLSQPDGRLNPPKPERGKAVPGHCIWQRPHTVTTGRITPPLSWTHIPPESRLDPPKQLEGAFCVCSPFIRLLLSLEPPKAGLTQCLPSYLV